MFLRFKMIDTSKKQMVESKFTKYEIARILGARALQLAMNAPMLLRLNKDELEAVNYDPLKIAELELYADILPITVKRPLPQKSAEKITKAKEEIKEKVEEKPKKREEEEKRPEEKIEEKGEEDIIKEVAGTEVMELATPEDEGEVIESFEAEGE